MLISTLLLCRWRKSIGFSICISMATKANKKISGLLKENQEQLEKIGNRIKQLRLKAGYTSAEKFAYEHGIDRTQYARYERGEDMRITSLLKVVAAHGLSLQDFFKIVS